LVNSLVGVARAQHASVLYLINGILLLTLQRRVCCLISEQYVVMTGGHCSRMERQRTPHGPRWTIWKRAHILHWTSHVASK